MDSVEGGGTNATRIGANYFSPDSPRNPVGTSTDFAVQGFEPSMHQNGSNQGCLKHPYVWKTFIDDAKDDGLGRTAFVELYVHLLSGTT